jgi:hypothetical protein
MTEVAGAEPLPAPVLPAVRELAIPAVVKPSHHRPVPAPISLPSRLRGAVASLVPHAQYQLTRLGSPGIAGIATLVAAVVITLGTLIPARNAIRTLDVDVERAMKRPPSGGTPEEGLGKFVAALPTRGQVPAVIGLVLQQAQQAGVPLDVGHYAFIPAKAGSVGRYELEFPVRASYPQVRDFIDRTLATVPAVGLDKLRIERKSVADQTVNADVRFVVFVRGE